MKHEPSMAMPVFMHSYSPGMSCTDSETCPLHELRGKPRLLQAGCRWACQVSGVKISALRFPVN